MCCVSLWYAATTANDKSAVSDIPRVADAICYRACEREKVVDAGGESVRGVGKPHEWSRNATGRRDVGPDHFAVHIHRENAELITARKR